MNAWDGGLMTSNASEEDEVFRACLYAYNTAESEGGRDRWRRKKRGSARCQKNAAAANISIYPMGNS